jgi:hypothetical protein
MGGATTETDENASSARSHQVQGSLSGCATPNNYGDV